jgi:hypothetical protein
MAMRIASKSKTNSFKLAPEPKGSERREHRRYELGGQTLSVNRWDGRRREALDLGYLVDLSACAWKCPATPASARSLKPTPAPPNRKMNGSVGWPLAA